MNLSYYFYKIIVILINRRAHFLDDKTYLSLKFRSAMGYWMDWNNPKTYNEKLQWLKVYYHNPLWTTLVDKYDVKKYVASVIGEQYIIPTLGLWDSFDEIDFDSLPDQFVLKCTHDSGGLVICKDKRSFNIEQARKKIEKSIHTNYFWRGREWPYKNVKPRIIAEKYMEDSSTQDLRDYKFFCFDGEVKALFIASERNTKGAEVKFNFYDENFNQLNIVQRHPMSTNYIKKPVTFDEMKMLASALSKGLPEARCDFYEVNGKVYFGEITFFHHGGQASFHPNEWDTTFGSWIKLPEKLC